MKVVLLHAFPLDERMWQPQSDALSERDVLAPRLYGRGKTMAEWADSVGEEIGGGEYVAVGASMGGYCALELVRRVPAAKGVVLAGSRADADSDERRAGRAETIRLIRTEGVAALWQTMRPRLLPETAEPELVQEAQRIAQEQKPRRLIEAVEAIRDREDLTEVARSLPLLIVVGRADPFVDRAYAERLAKGHDRGRAVTLDGGHLISFQRPAEFNRLLNEFLWRA